MENTRTYIWEITNDILDNYFTGVDKLSSLIHPDPVRATRIIVNKITRTLQDFEKYCPLTAQSYITTTGDGYYTFVNNYLDIVEEHESMDNLELVPKTIARVGGGGLGTFNGNMSCTANYWEYHAPTLRSYARGQKILISALYHYPVYIRYTDTGLLSQDSHIFGLEDMQKGMLFNIMELKFLKFIKGNNERIKLPTSVDIMNLDTDIQDLDKKVEDDIGACSAATISWR